MQGATNSELLKNFIEAFELLDDRWVSQGEGAGGDLTPVLAAPWDEQGWSYRRPIKTEVPRTAVAEDLSGLLSAPLPALYEQLVMSYRWAEVDLGRIRLLPNLPPGLKDWPARSGATEASATRSAPPDISSLPEARAWTTTPYALTSGCGFMTAIAGS